MYISITLLVANNKRSGMMQMNSPTKNSLLKLVLILTKEMNGDIRNCGNRETTPNNAVVPRLLVIADPNDEMKSAICNIIKLLLRIFLVILIIYFTQIFILAICS